MILLALLACAPEPRPAPRDADGDGWPEGWDCDERDAAVNADAHEVCNGKDDDCDGTIDVDAEDVQTWFQDADGDGYGDPERGVTTCEPVGILDGTDCDDANPSVHAADADEDCPGPLDIDPLGADVVIHDALDQGLFTHGSTLDADYDGDGVRDLVVMLDWAGYWPYSWPRGRVHFFSGARIAGGATLTFEDADQVLSGGSETTDDYAEVGELVGASLAAVPDVDGDGCDEILAVAPLADLGRGRAYLLGGGRIAGGSSLAEAELTTFLELGALGYTSSADAHADFDGDGLVDPTIASIPEEDEQRGGSVYVFRGRADPWPAELTRADADVSILPSWEGSSLLGGALADDGDVDGDGRDDLIVTDFHEAGAVYGYLATTLASAGSLTTADADFVVTAEGGSEIGQSLRYAGDADGDGLADVSFVVHYTRKWAYVMYGSTLMASGQLPFTDADIALEARDYFLGAPVVRAGDDGPELWLDLSDSASQGPTGICRLPAVAAGSYWTDDCYSLISMPDRRVHSLTSGDLGALGTANTLAATAEDEDAYVFLFFEAW